MDEDRLRAHEDYSWKLLLEQMRQHGLTHEDITEIAEIVRQGIRLYGGRPQAVSQHVRRELWKPKVR